jgi:hypothetical protein
MQSTTMKIPASRPDGHDVHDGGDDGGGGEQAAFESTGMDLMLVSERQSALQMLQLLLQLLQLLLLLQEFETP